MRRYWIVGMALAALGLVAYNTPYMADRRAYAQDPLADLAHWEPEAAALKQAMGPVDAANPAGKYNDARHKQFAMLFQNRFRTHNPAMAVGLHFRDNKSIRLLCPARLEPWYTNRLALEAFHESQMVFGKPFHIEIYYTYIGTPPLRIGTLLPEAAHPDCAQIIYKYPPSRFIY